MILIKFKFRTKFLSDEWMIARGFSDVAQNDKDPWWFSSPISELKDHLKPIEDYIIEDNIECSKAIQILKSKSIDCLLHFENGLEKKSIKFYLFL